MAIFNINRKVKAKSTEPPKVERDKSQERMARLSTQEVYTFVETSLMSAQQNLTKYRTAPNNLDALAALEWASTDVDFAKIGVEELQSRILDR